jgi:hypothetical protein
MSDTLAFDPPRPLAAQALLGAASPLWAYFAGAAASGVAVWWMLWLVRPQTLQALCAFAELPALGGVTGLEPNEALVPIAAPTAEVEIAALEAERPFVTAAPSSEASGAAKAAPDVAANDLSAA